MQETMLDGAPNPTDSDVVPLVIDGQALVFIGGGAASPDEARLFARELSDASDEADAMLAAVLMDRRERATL